MTLKHAKLALAENLPRELQKEAGTAEGLVIIETTNDELKNTCKAIKDGGIREYLLTLGTFKDIEIKE